MLKKPWEILLVLIIAISVLVSIIMGWQRVALERANRQLELALEYSEVERLSRWAGMETGEVLRLFQEKGVTGVLFKEDNLADLATRQVWVKTGTELLAEREGIGNLSAEIKSDYTYI
ncbi:MAG TPA: hypothetical protein GX711_10085, partial [Clostridia bacterium]|nr:hypothetical protein [Clostridia bacterium]